MASPSALGDIEIILSNDEPLLACDSVDATFFLNAIGFWNCWKSNKQIMIEIKVLKKV